MEIDINFNRKVKTKIKLTSTHFCLCVFKSFQRTLFSVFKLMTGENKTNVSRKVGTINWK